MVFVYGAVVGVTMFTIGFLACYVRTMHQQQMLYETRLFRSSRIRQNKRHSHSSASLHGSCYLDVSPSLPLSSDSGPSLLLSSSSTSRKRPCISSLDTASLMASSHPSLLTNRSVHRVPTQVAFQDNDSNDGDEDDATTSSI